MARDPRYPNLFLIGAMRSGTTLLHEQLGRHPDIFMCQPKEPAFFADPNELERDSFASAQLGIGGDEQRYLELFDAGAGAVVRGESSTQYSKRPIINGVAERIRASCPDAHILYIMRDPVERSLSHYLWRVHRGGESRGVLDAIHDSEQYLAFSDYAFQVEPYLQNFGPNRVKSVVFEEMIRDPNDMLREIHAWLGLDPIAFESRLPIRNAVPERVRVQQIPGFADRVSRSRVRRSVWRLTMAAARRGWLRRFESELSAAEIRTPEVLLHLRTQLTPAVQRLSALLNRSFPIWSTVHGE